MNIAILGFGTVGTGVYEIIKQNSLSHINVVKILRPRHLKNEYESDKELLRLFVQSFDDILADDNIDTVVECMGGLDPAYTFVKKAMEKGKNVVTSNKMLVATYYDDLIKLADENDVYFLYEASVGGGIQWIENLTRSTYVDDIVSFKGIMNGTTNYILDKMTKESVDFDEVLKEAQNLGYAEKDPSSDIDGDDALYKCLISANAASKKSYILDTVKKYGIRNLLKEDIDYFKEKNLVCKLIAEYDAKNNFMIVIPELFDKNEGIANVSLNNNYMELTLKLAGKFSYFGQGAGKYPTAYSILADLVRVEQKTVVPIFTTESVACDYTGFKGSFYLRKKNKEKTLISDIMFKDIDLTNVDFIAKVNI